MPSTRRLKAFGIIVLLAVIVTLYVTSAARQTRSSQFYTKTQDALAEARAHKEQALGGSSGGVAGDDQVGRRLKEAEEAAKRAADKKGDEFHGEDVKEKVLSAAADAKAKVADGEKSVAGRKTMKDSGSEAVLKEENAKGKEQSAETEEDHKVKNELNDILKRSPIIIFSKSYCPYSKKAKHILLDGYKISPPPYVVELDLHPLGPQLQARLAEMTGRKTVPNILINGRSIGGGDDVQSLHESGKLVDTVKSMGGKRMEVTKVEETGNSGSEKKRRRRVAGLAQ